MFISKQNALVQNLYNSVGSRQSVTANKTVLPRRKSASLQKHSCYWPIFELRIKNCLFWTKTGLKQNSLGFPPGELGHTAG